MGDRVRTAFEGCADLVTGRPVSAVVRAELREGLALVEAGRGGRGLRPETVREARELAAGAPLSSDKRRRLCGWLARHGAAPREVAARRRQARALDRGEVRGRLPALTSWLLWGGDVAACGCRR